jgi:hypothetical protein
MAVSAFQYRKRGQEFEGSEAELFDINVPYVTCACLRWIHILCA